MATQQVCLTELGFIYKMLLEHKLNLVQRQLWSGLGRQGNMWKAEKCHTECILPQTFIDSFPRDKSEQGKMKQLHFEPELFIIIYLSLCTII